MKYSIFVGELDGKVLTALDVIPLSASDAGSGMYG
jgi:hypothetical protein|tara:strand:- start:1414 stop:1518 length:105 start_codon:yes stop_codon:yes gene_type:complete